MIEGHTSFHRVIQTGFLAGLVLVLPMGAGAQEAAEGADKLQIDEITVTATKREETIQDIPLAVSAFGAAELESRGVEDILDLQQVSASLQITGGNDTSRTGAVRIRGVGTSVNNVGVESSVGIFLDGIYRSRAGHALQDLVDVERVEVLRGPQGTLFGKNTSAGALRVISRAPEFVWGGDVSATIGNFDARKLTGAVTGPLIDGELAFRLAGSWHERDGFLKESIRGFDAVDRDRFSFKGQLLWTPSEDLRVRVIADYTEHDEVCCPGVVHTNGPLTPLIESLSGESLPDNALDIRRFGADAAPEEKIEDWGISAEANYDLGDGTVATLLLSYREFEADRFADVDYTGASLFLFDSGDEFETFVGEFRVAGTYEGLLEGLDWLAGVYVSSEDIRHTDPTVFGTDLQAYLQGLGIPGFVAAGFLPGQEAKPGIFEQETTTAALFTHNTLHLTDWMEFSLGARVTYEDKEASKISDTTIFAAGFGFVADPSNPLASELPAPGSAADPSYCSTIGAIRNIFRTICDNFSWKDDFDSTDWSFFGGFGFTLSEEHRLYLSYSRSFKSGGWNSNPDALTLNQSTGVFGDGRRFKPEFSDNYELTLKSSMLEGRLNVNTTAFHNVFAGFQRQQFNGLVTFINNLTRVKSRGVEVEAQWAVNEWLDASVGVTYADTRVGDHLEPPIPGNTLTFPLEGTRLGDAPAWSYVVGLFAEREIGSTGWTGIASANYFFRGRTSNVDTDPAKAMDSFHRTNAQLGVRSPDERWEIVAWVENIEDDVQPGTRNSPLQSGSISAFASTTPRFYGLTVRYSFGGD